MASLARAQRVAAVAAAAARLTAVKSLAALPSVVLRRHAGHWNYEWSPGPYPRTKEERLAAAKKYNLQPEDYEPYPEDGFLGMGLGDYPNLPRVRDEILKTIDVKAGREKKKKTSWRVRRRHWCH